MCWLNSFRVIVAVLAAVTIGPDRLAGPVSATEALPAVWLVPSLERIGRNTTAGSGLSLELYAARGEYESFQIAIQAPSGGLSNVTIHIGDLPGGERGRIAASNITIYWEHYVHVTKGSPDLGGTNRPLGAGWYPDALIPVSNAAERSPRAHASSSEAGFNIAAHQNQPVWVDIFVPPETPAGRYRTAVTVVSGERRVEREILLQVWNFTIPRTPSLNSELNAWKANDVYTQTELLKHRLMPAAVHPEHQSSLIRQGLKSVNIALSSGASNQSCTMSPAPSTEMVREEAAWHHPSLRRYSYTADEIDLCRGLYDTIKAWGRVLHEAGVDNLITMTPVPELYDDGSGTGRSAVDIWAILPLMYDSAPERVSEVLKKGDEVWSYNALVQDDYSPKWAIDFAPINYRIQPGFMNQSLGFTGLLYWRIDLWTEDPWNNVQTYVQDSDEYPGEGMLVYPGTTVGAVGVVPSMRLKWLRDGVDDYEYIEILKRAGCVSEGLKFARTVASSWSKWTKDPVFLELQRRELGAFVAQLSTSGERC